MTVGVWSGWSAVADVGGAGRGAGVFDEDLALQVADGDRVGGLVAVGDDEDLVEASPSVDHVLDLVQVEGAVGGQRLDDGVVGQVGGWRCGGGSGPAGRRADQVIAGPGGLGFRGGFPGGQGCDAAGQALVRAPGVVEVVEGVDLVLQFVEGFGEWLFVEVAEQGLVEAFVLALGGRLVGLAGDRLDAQAITWTTSWPRSPRRDGLSAIPLSDSSRCGTPWAVTALSNTAIAASKVSLQATCKASA